MPDAQVMLGLLYALFICAAESFAPGHASLSPRALSRFAPLNCADEPMRLPSAFGACSFQSASGLRSAHAGFR